MPEILQFLVPIILLATFGTKNVHSALYVLNSVLQRVKHTYIFTRPRRARRHYKAQRIFQTADLRRVNSKY